MLDLNYTLEQMGLTDVYRTFHSTAAEYIFFSSSTWNILQERSHHKTILSQFKKAEVIPSNFSDLKGMKLGINNRRKTGKFTQTWKLNNTLLNNQWVKEEIKRNI